MRTLERSCAGAALLSSLLMIGCSGPSHEPNEKYVLVAANTKLPYWQNALAGLNHAASEMKVKAEMVGPDSYDPKGEREELQREVGTRPAGILVSSADATVLGPEIDSAIAKGIPVITMDSDAPDSKRIMFVGTDNYRAGQLGAKLTSKLLGGKGNVVIFTIPNQANLNDRLRGYQDGFNQAGGIKVNQVVDMKGDPTVAFDTTKQMIDSKAKVDAFVCLEAIACPEVGEVVNRANMTGKVKIVAMDTDQRTIDWIQKGVISATIAQRPWTMAYFGAKVLGDLHMTKFNPSASDYARDPKSPLPTFVDTGSFTVDKDNVAAFSPANAGK